MKKEQKFLLLVMVFLLLWFFIYDFQNLIFGKAKYYDSIVEYNKSKLSDIYKDFPDYNYLYDLKKYGIRKTISKTYVYLWVSEGQYYRETHNGVVVGIATPYYDSYLAIYTFENDVIVGVDKLSIEDYRINFDDYNKKFFSKVPWPISVRMQISFSDKDRLKKQEIELYPEIVIR